MSPPRRGGTLPIRCDEGKLARSSRRPGSSTRRRGDRRMPAATRGLDRATAGAVHIAQRARSGDLTRRRRHAEQRGQCADHACGPRRADGQPHAPVPDPSAPLDGAARAGLRAHPPEAARRTARGVPRCGRPGGCRRQRLPHRGASLFFGRNDEHGIRCVYYGGKIDAMGACVDTPNEPLESNFKAKVHATAYPVPARIPDTSSLSRLEEKRCLRRKRTS